MSWLKTNRERLKIKPVRLQASRRRAVIDAIKETCEKRRWTLFAANVRSNHVHSVVDIGVKKSEIALNAFKANATRIMRERGLWLEDGSPWADKGSKRRLWKDNDVDCAIAYVKYEQGEPLRDEDE
jgi:REP element-mobilizing transposase RayT